MVHGTLSIPTTSPSPLSDHARSTRLKATEHIRHDLLLRDLQKYTELIIAILMRPSSKSLHYARCLRLRHTKTGTLIKWMSPRHTSTAFCPREKSSIWKCLQAR